MSEKQEPCYVKRSFYNEDIHYGIHSRKTYTSSPQDAKPDNTLELPTFIPNAPMRVYFDPTYRCNLRCRHCITSSSPDIQAENELDILQIKKLLNELESIGVLELAITGGEPFIHKDIFEIIEFVQDGNMNLSITSNGTLLSPEKAKKLSELDVSDIRISLDGCESVNDDIRGDGSYKKAMTGLRNLIQANVPATVRMTLTSKTHEGLEHLFHDLQDVGVTKLKAAIIKEAGNATLEENSDLFGYQPTEDAVQSLMKLGEENNISVELSSEDFNLEPEQSGDKRLRAAEHHTCGAGHETAYISPIGNVLPCSSMPHVILGNIGNDSFTDVWEGRVTKKYKTLARLSEEKAMCKANFVKLWL